MTTTNTARALATLQRRLKAALAKIERLETSWQNDPAQWRAHVAKYNHRRAIEASARKHGQSLGAEFRALLVARLVIVDVDRNGAHLAHETATRLVEAWSLEGKTSARQ